MLIINQAEVIRTLPMGTCITLMRDTLAALSRGEALQPLRDHLALPDKRGVLAWMPGYLSPVNAIGIKVLTVFGGNEGTAYDSHQGAVLLFEEEHGSLVAVMDATAITAIRTAAVSGVATDLLAVPGAGDLAILGAGTQALSHIESMQQVRLLRRVRIWNRTPERARSLAAIAAARFALAPEVCATVREAVEGADLICTTTAARDPILESAWIRPGAHLNVVGSSIRNHREVDSATVARAQVFVDRRESALHEAGDLVIPLREGVISENHILAELGDVVIGTHPGRRSEKAVTLFKSQGIAVEDVAAARHIYLEARRTGIGTDVPFGGQTHVQVPISG